MHNPMEKTNIKNRIKEITLRLTNVLSVSETPGEIEVSKEIYTILSEMDYFKNNPDDLFLQDISTDRHGRKNVIAMIRGQKNPENRKTVVLMGHSDTVGISDFGNLQDLATQPEELTKRMNENAEKLPQDVQEDLEKEGENYIFGRGIFDMKSGVAALLTILEGLSNDLENLEGNIILGIVCDEEVNSTGMFALVKLLNELKVENNFDLVGLIDADYMSNEYKGDENKYVYVGAVGKLMPSFYVVGDETHVGEPFNGIDSNQITAEILKKINMNTDYCDEANGQYTLPPISLKMRDLKPEYTVQTAKASHLFFNYATHSQTPDEVLSLMVDAAEEAMTEAIQNLDTQYKKYAKMSGIQYKPLRYQSRVITIHELLEEVRNEIGDTLDEEIQKFEEKHVEDTNIDEREYALLFVQHVHGLWSHNEPVVVVFFSPPYYPHILIEDDTIEGEKVIDAVSKAIEGVESDYKIVYKDFFPYIADISFASAPQDKTAIETLKTNMPGFQSKYKFPIDEMAELNLPAINIGPFGKDAHKFTERLETNYSFTVTPELILNTTLNLLSE